MSIPIPFVGPLQEGVVPRINSQRTINMVPQVESPGARVPVSLRYTPGMVRYLAAGSANSGCRPGSGKIFQGNSYWVFGNEVVKVDTAGNRTRIGLLDTDGGLVSIALNHLELCIVDGSNNVYSYIPTNATPWAKTSLSGIGDVCPTFIVMKDFYFAINRTYGNVVERGNFYLSAINDGRTFLGAATNAESSPDAISAMAATSNDIIILGERTIQHYVNIGSTAFQFDPARGRDISWGIHAPASISKIDDTVYLLAICEGAIKFLKHPGGVISDPDMDSILARMTRTDDCRAFTYAQDGHFQVQFTFPTEDRTFVYDLHSQKFYEKKSHGVGRHLATAALFFNGKLLVGREDTGYLYEWDWDTYTDDGEIIERERRAPVAFEDSDKEMICDYLKIIIDAGIGSIAGEDPQMMLDYSTDGGKTFHGEQWAGAGKQGEYDTMPEFDSLGSSRTGFIFRWRATDPAPWVILGAVGSFSKGDW